MFEFNVLGAFSHALLLSSPVATLWAQIPVGKIQLEIKDPKGLAMEASGKLKNLVGGRE